eukprot:TRINITY_DN7792_c0_g1_i1.p1 TRINITY_DN7792_c0_g1~~TRINITY_DN7792_c0_g1_i1.p1  ORF type:complete len:184 (+),score=26.11 TRINITY_DN7792_c0_g1_i1:132-683(+)
MMEEPKTDDSEKPPLTKAYSLSTTKVYDLIKDAKERALKDSKWSEEFELKIPKIDAQHENLFHLVATVMYLVRYEGSGSLKSVKLVLQEFYDYTFTHFKDEEDLFLTEEWPGAASHIEAHNTFTSKVKKTIEDFEVKGTEVLNEELLDFFLNWLKNHIVHSDPIHGAWVLGRRSKSKSCCVMM